MQTLALDIARRHGLIGAVMTTDIRRLVAENPATLANDGALAAALLGLGYSKGEVEARLFMSPEGRA